MRHCLPSLALWLIGSFTVLSQDRPWPPAPSFIRSPAEQAEDRMTQHLSKIVVPKVDFKETTLSDAVKFLRAEARRLDPHHRGITIDFEPPITEPSLTATYHDIPLWEALRYVSSLAGLQLHPTQTGAKFAGGAHAPHLVKDTLSLPKEIFGEKARPEDYGVDPQSVADFMADPLSYIVSEEIREKDIRRITIDRGSLILTTEGTREAIDLLYKYLEALIPRPVPGPDQTAISPLDPKLRDVAYGAVVERIKDVSLVGMELDCPVEKALAKLNASIQAAAKGDPALRDLRIQLAEKPKSEVFEFARKRVTLKAREITLVTALEEITQQAGGVLYLNRASRFDPVSTLIEIGPPESDPVLIDFEYYVPPGFAMRVDRVDSEAAEDRARERKDWLYSSGVSYGPTACTIYLPGSGALVARENMAAHEEIREAMKVEWERYYASVEWKEEKLRVQRLRKLFPHWTPVKASAPKPGIPGLEPIPGAP